MYWLPQPVPSRAVPCRVFDYACRRIFVRAAWRKDRGRRRRRRVRMRRRWRNQAAHLQRQVCKAVLNWSAPPAGDGLLPCDIWPPERHTVSSWLRSGEPDQQLWQREKLRPASSRLLMLASNYTCQSSQDAMCNYQLSLNAAYGHSAAVAVRYTRGKYINKEREWFPVADLQGQWGPRIVTLKRAGGSLVNDGCFYGAF